MTFKDNKNARNVYRIARISQLNSVFVEFKSVTGSVLRTHYKVKHLVVSVVVIKKLLPYSRILTNKIKKPCLLKEVNTLNYAIQSIEERGTQWDIRGRI